METCMIYGTGGHALTVEELALKAGYTVTAFFDDQVKAAGTSGDKVIMAYDQAYNSWQPVVIAIGSNTVRKKIAGYVTHTYCTLQDSSAIVSKGVVIGEGTVIMPGTVIQAGVHIGAHCIINIGSAIDHEVRIGAFVHIGPKCYIGGGVIIGEGACIGAGSIIMRNTVIAPWTDIAPQSLIV